MKLRILSTIVCLIGMITINNGYAMTNTTLKTKDTNLQRSEYFFGYMGQGHVVKKENNEKISKRSKAVDPDILLSLDVEKNYYYTLVCNFISFPADDVNIPVTFAWNNIIDHTMTFTLNGIRINPDVINDRTTISIPSSNKMSQLVIDNLLRKPNNFAATLSMDFDIKEHEIYTYCYASKI